MPLTRPRVILDHSIVGQHLTGLQFRKDREYAACRLCGAVFQSRLAIELPSARAINTPDTPQHAYTPLIQQEVAVETQLWRNRHNRTHPDWQHIALRRSGRTFTPEAALRLAPYGIVSLDGDTEIAAALWEAPRLPTSEPERF